MRPTLQMLDDLSRQRSLTAAESRRLERQLQRGRQLKGQKPWNEGDERRLVAYLARGKRPAMIAILMNRTERAIWTKMWRKGWRVWMAEKGQLPDLGGIDL